MAFKRETPGPGQESVWDYPRPPRLEKSDATVRVVVAETTIAETNQAYRMLEESHPPVFYIPPSDIQMHCLERSQHKTFCEWKGTAEYYDVVVSGRRIRRAGWYYPNPSKRYPELADYVAFYPSKMDACYVGEEKVVAQEGDFYGGWITQNIVGPFKGGTGTFGW